VCQTLTAGSPDASTQCRVTRGVLHWSHHHWPCEGGGVTIIAPVRGWSRQRINLKPSSSLTVWRGQSWSLPLWGDGVIRGLHWSHHYWLCEEVRESGRTSASLLICHGGFGDSWKRNNLMHFIAVGGLVLTTLKVWECTCMWEHRNIYACPILVSTLESDHTS